MKQTKDQGVKVGLTAMIVRGGKVLLGERNNTETAKGLLAFPGGRMDYGEDPESGIIREVEEETGIVIGPKGIKFLRFANEFFPEENKHYVSLVFLVWKFNGEPQLREPDKCKGWEWFDPKEIPENIFIPCLETIEKYKQAIIIAHRNEVIDSLG